MLGRRALILAVGGALGACNFRPMLLAEAPGDDRVREELAAIEITGMSGRLGYLVRNALLDDLNPQSLDVPARYVLDVDLTSSATALGIQLDSTITRFNLTLIARFRLLDRASQEVRYASLVRRVSSYNVSREPYADLVASETAEERAAEEVSTDIRTLLAVHFAKMAPVT